MTLRERTGAVVVGGVAAAVLSAGAVAWACTPYTDGDGFGTSPEAPASVSQDQSPAAQPATEPQVQPQAHSESAPVVDAAGAPAPAPATAWPSHGVRTARAATTRQPARTAPAATSVAPVPAQLAAEPAPSTAVPVLPSMSSVASDLWSGFAAGTTRAQGPTIVGSSPTAGHGSEWAIGLGLLGAGLVVLGAGTGVTLARRPKVLA